jgi:hypothetical protein
VAAGIPFSSRGIMERRVKNAPKESAKRNVLSAQKNVKEIIVVGR